MAKSGNKRLTRSMCGCLILLVFCLSWYAWPRSETSPGDNTLFALQIDPAATADPLAIPELPDNPTQVDIGRVSYYYNCMPCHGDHGQGLTEEWRMTWVEDHRNCWDRGCHAGRPGDEGFPIPTAIPALAGEPGALADYSSPPILHHYLEETHPPQSPGSLPEGDYWALTAFLLDENGQLPPGDDLGPEATTTPVTSPTATIAPTVTPPAATAVAAAPAATAHPTPAPPAAAPSTIAPTQLLALAAALVIAIVIAFAVGKARKR